MEKNSPFYHNKKIPHRSPIVPIKHWSANASIEFLILHEQNNNHWLQISKIMKHKTEHDVKNHFYSLLRKYIAKIAANNFEFEGQLDIIQCYYIAQHIMYYFSREPLAKKEYLSTLISLRKITHPQCSHYYEALCALHPYIKKVGWKNYLVELNSIEPLTTDGYCFPNRILPQIGLRKDEVVPIEDKKCFMNVWTHYLSAFRCSHQFN